MKTKEHWIEQLRDVSTERDHLQWVEAIQQDARCNEHGDMQEQIDRLREKAERLREHVGFQSRAIVRHKRTIEKMNAAHLALMIEHDNLLTARIATGTLNS